MKSLQSRRRFSSRFRRALRNSGLWLLAITALVCIIAYRRLRSQLPPSRPAIVALNVRCYPPIADTIVHPKTGEITFHDFFQDLSTQVGVPFEINWTSLERGGIGPTDTISSEITFDTSMPFERALARVVGNNQLGVDYTSNPILIAAPEELASRARCQTIIYPTADLLQLDSPWLDREDPKARRDALVNLIVFATDSREWNYNGGAASINIDDHARLTVTANPNLQYRVQQLLKILREH